jgi:acetyl-CoA synthetase
MYASHVLPTARDYGALYRSFRWQIPARYNIGVDVCDRWAEIDPARCAKPRTASPTRSPPAASGAGIASRCSSHKDRRWR